MITFSRTQTREAYVSTKERVGRTERVALTYTHSLSPGTAPHSWEETLFSWLFLRKGKRRLHHTSNIPTSQRGFPRDWLLSHCLGVLLEPSYSSGTTENKDHWDQNSCAPHWCCRGHTVHHAEANMAQQPFSVGKEKSGARGQFSSFVRASQGTGFCTTQLRALTGPTIPLMTL